MTDTTTARPKAAPPPPKPKKYRPAAAAALAPIAFMTKRQDELHDLAVEIAKDLGWEGELLWVLHEIAVGDAQNFIRKTLHEIHIGVVNDKPQPDYAAAAEHLGLTGDDAALLVNELTQAFDAEVAEFKGHDKNALEKLLKKLHDEDVVAREKALIAMATHKS